MAIFNQITIVGVGLMGGSLAKSIRKNRIAKKIIGYFRNNKKLKKAIKDKLVDKGFLSFSESIANSDLIILALPIEQIIKFLYEFKKLSKNKQTLIIDIGSTKTKITDVANKLDLNFIGTHPLAGSEKKGSVASSSSLFEDSIVIITPTQKTKRQPLIKIKKLWNKLGAKPVRLSPKQHDHILAFTSHLPHVISFSLINSIPQRHLKFGASGLKDTTRIALSDSKIWSEIFFSNKNALLKSINSYEFEIKRIKKAIKDNRINKLINILKASKIKREQIN